MSRHYSEEIIVNIFSRLPVKSIKRFNCVCKPWLKLFSDPKFVKLCLKHALKNSNFKILASDLKRFYSVVFGSPLNFSIGSSSSSSSSASLSLSMPMSPIFDSATKVNLPFGTGKYGINLLGTCNGLLSFLGTQDTVCFWNPTTNEYKRVPSASIERPEAEGLGMIRSLRYGFGHDSENDVYKVASLVDFCDYGCTVKVLTLGTEEWRLKSHVPYGFQHGHLYGVLVNEAVHWVANPLSATLPYDGVRIVLSFDVKSEMFKEVPQPQNLNEPNHITLGEFGRKLCLIDHDCHTVSVNFWVMNEYGRSESWTKQIIISLQTVIPSFKYVIPVQRFRNGEIILEIDNGTLILYNPKEEHSRVLHIRQFNKHFEVTTYIESLVSPKQITLVKQEQAGMVIETKGEA
ncbi:F-box/kelch-repeat protein At3g06240-like [Papaver somniferum]|uniref:F-box/kelch-repeat protein At3g06240-like n=1 Tax=Papaver somniferum TaxID=3469 RepID=UPI000E6F518D|nr:F-box/kelch-repeat protein At3g06240-like [Papaver somniferum]